MVWYLLCVMSIQRWGFHRAITILTFSRRNFPAPHIVPLVPLPATRTSTFPPHCSHICHFDATSNWEWYVKWEPLFWAITYFWPGSLIVSTWIRRIVPLWCILRYYSRAIESNRHIFMNAVPVRGSRPYPLVAILMYPSTLELIFQNHLKGNGTPVQSVTELR